MPPKKKVSTPAMVYIVPGEKRLIKAFAELGFDYETEPMDVGDIQIRLPDENGEYTIVELILERKEGKDLCSSITDGRYEEQKSRIISLFNDGRMNASKVYYLIENFCAPDGRYGYETPVRKRMWSSITNTLYRDGFHVFQSKTLEESAEFINSLKNSVSKWSNTSHDTTTDGIKVHEVNLKKKKVTPDDFFMHSLMLIKGMQEDSAASIVELYPTFNSLIGKYNRMIEKGLDPNKLFKDTLRQSGSRKIGPAMSKKVFEFFEPQL
jgi:crossover junction endonuclease MUS81